MVGGGGVGAGGGGADRVQHTRVSGHARTRSCIKEGRTGASAPVPSAGLTSRKSLRLFPSEGRFQAFPAQTSPYPKPRKKITRLANLSPCS